MTSKEMARQLIPLIDLTSLNDDDTPQKIERLCHQAQTPYGSVAAVCIYPQFVKQAHALLAKTPINLATVANFPSGDELLADCIESIQQSLDDGADEIDVVMPYKNYLEGNTDAVKEFLKTCRDICSSNIILKVILETGALIKNDAIFDAATLAIQTGADFIKTSTGKIATGATLQAAEIILDAIKNHPDKKVGLKISGGVRTVEQAMEYWQLAENTMGRDWITPRTLRFGASQLLADILSLDPADEPRDDVPK